MELPAHLARAKPQRPSTTAKRRHKHNASGRILSRAAFLSAKRYTPNPGCPILVARFLREQGGIALPSTSAFLFPLPVLKKERPKQIVSNTFFYPLSANRYPLS